MPRERDMGAARALAARFGYVLEQDFIALCGITAGTAESWRKRGTGPSYVLAGCQYLYPEKDVGAWIGSRLRENTTDRLSVVRSL